MASTDLRPLWWMTPIQAVAALAAGINCGASGFQSPVVFPMLMLPDVPALYAGKQMRYLLHASDQLFPRVNAFGTVANLLLAVVAFLKRDQYPVAGNKWKWLAAAWLCNVGATVWTFTFMVPRNNQMRAVTKRIEENPADEKAERDFRRIQGEWRLRAHGRALIMMAASAIGIYTIFQDGKYYL